MPGVPLCMFTQNIFELAVSGIDLSLLVFFALAVGRILGLAV